MTSNINIPSAMAMRTIVAAIKLEDANYTSVEDINFNKCAKEMFKASIDGKYKVSCYNIGEKNLTELVKKDYSVKDGKMPGEVRVSWKH